MKKYLFYLFALMFVITAVYHFVALFFHVNDSPKWRHALFVGINAVCIYGLLKRPKWFLYAFGILLIQQLSSHGTQLVNTWFETHRIDWIDLSVVVFTPLMFLVLLYDRVAEKQ